MRLSFEWLLFRPEVHQISPNFFRPRHVSVENQSDEVHGLGSVSVWSGGMEIKEIG